MVVLAAVLVAGCTPSASHEFAGAALDAPQPVPDFTLTGSDGSPVSLSDFRGQYVYLYFGYTFCPDICPTTLAKLARVRSELGDEAGRMQVVMVSVDPERDTPEALGDYVTRFDPTFIGLTGSKADIDAAGEAFGLFYERHEGSAATGYLIDHTARAFLIGPDGRALVAYPHDAPDEDVLADLRWLMAQES
jgi:protein SCO1/2